MTDDLQKIIEPMSVAGMHFGSFRSRRHPSTSSYIFDSKGQVEIIKLLYASDIFVMPTRRIEGFPMTLVEAMFSGIPIVATKIGGVSEAVWDEETGFLVDTPDVLDFLGKLEVLINDKKLREEFGRNAINRARNLFSAGKMVEKYVSVFKEVLNENS